MAGRVPFYAGGFPMGASLCGSGAIGIGLSQRGAGTSTVTIGIGGTAGGASAELCAG